MAFKSILEGVMRTASWVIVNKSSNKAIFETFNESVISKINQEKYQAIPILAYLQNLNKAIKGN